MDPVVAPAAKPRADYRAWDPRYPEVVRALVAALQPPEFVSIEHVGGTAIPGCGGKGVIDLLALYRDGFLEAAKTFLLGAGFGRQGPEFARRWPEERPMYLGVYRWNAEPVLVYVHVVHQAADEVRRFRTFRERLRGDRSLVEEYGRVKQGIIAGGVTDTDDYAVAKRAFMHRVLGDDHALTPGRRADAGGAP